MLGTIQRRNGKRENANALTETQINMWGQLSVPFKKPWDSGTAVKRPNSTSVFKSSS